MSGAVSRWQLKRLLMICHLLQVGLRSAIAALFIGLLFQRRDNIFGLLRDRNIAKMGAIVGLLFALEFVLVSVGITLTTASHMALYLYTAPLFSAIGLHFLYLKSD